MSKKTIALVYHTMHIGGVEKELLAFINHIDQRSYHIHLLLTSKTGELLNDIPQNVKIHELGENSYSPNIKHLIRLYRTLRKLKPDVVVGFMQDICFNILFVRQISMLPYKVLVSEHIVLSTWQVFTQTSLFKKILIRYLYQLADAVIAPSPLVLDDLEKKFDIRKSNLHLLPNYIVKSEKKDSINQACELPEKFFLFAGRFDQQKNIFILLKAFKLLVRNRKYSNIKLVLVGKEHDKSYRRFCELIGLSNAVIFAGYTTDVTPYYKKAIGLVLPSHVEGMPRVVIEAMLARCPVILSNFPGHQALVENGKEGLIFDKNSSTSLAACLRYFVKNKKQRVVFSQNALVRMKKIYNNKFEISFRMSINNLLNKMLD